MSESNEAPIQETELRANWFRNSYTCPRCGTDWHDEWSCMCNDRCPTCNIEVTPLGSMDMSSHLTAEDYKGAARYIFGTEISVTLVKPEDAKEYAEAMLEGGLRRLEQGRIAAVRLALLASS